MRLVTCFPPTLLAFALAAFGLSTSCSSQTSKQIKSFAAKICKCTDAACATAVQVEYLQWWKDNQRARGSEGDRKDIEKAMQRYAECHLALVGPGQQSPAVPVPKVDLTRPAPSAPAVLPAPNQAGAPTEAAEPPTPSADVKPSEPSEKPNEVAPKPAQAGQLDQ